MGIRPEFFILMSEIEELWIGATNSETFKRVNNAITEESGIDNGLIKIGLSYKAYDYLYKKL